MLQAHLYSKDYAVAGTPVFQGLGYGMHTCTPRVTVLQAHLYSKDYAVAGTPVFQGLRCCRHTCISRVRLWNAHLYPKGCAIPCKPACPSRLAASTPRTRLPYKCLVCTIHISNVSFTNNSVLCSQRKQCCNNSRTCLELWARVLLGLLHEETLASNKI